MAVHRNYRNASGYYLFGVRYYDPSLGRWTQQDPVGGSLGDLNSGNRYTYANDDPVNEVDPSGRFSAQCVVLFIGTALGIFAGAFQLSPPIIALIGALAAGSIPLDVSAAGIAAIAGLIALTALFIGALLYCLNVP